MENKPIAVQFYKFTLANGTQIELALTLGVSKLQSILSGGDFIADKLNVVRVPAVAAVERITREQYTKDHNGKTYEELSAEVAESVEQSRELINYV